MSDETLRRRGCQYTSNDYRDELAALGSRVSMIRKGNYWDNAVAESFFSSLTSELLHRQIFDGDASLRSAVFEYIEVFCDRARLHSSLDDKTPAEVERAFALANAA
ncbi:MAG: integrase core domain-containing protein [Polyangiales bacterium]